MPGPNVLFVSGASGAGKSTFIDQLLADKLPDEIKGRLPTARQWSVLGGNDCIKSRISLDDLVQRAAGADNLLFHYDSAFIQRFGLRDYDDDPVFRVFDRAEQCTVIVIAPPPNRLLSQLSAREAARLRRRGYADLLWARYVRKPIWRLTMRLWWKQAIDTFDLFRDEPSIERSFEKWYRYVERLPERWAGVTVIYVEPIEGHRFRVRSPPTSAAC